MRDIAHKNSTDRYARAQAIVRTSRSVDELLELARADKGDPLSMARVAGIFAVKDTPRLIPLCHHITILHADCSFELGEREIRVLVEARTIGRTGVEVEAMTGASIAAVTIYDVLKPHDSAVSIAEVGLVEKRGGKSDFRREGSDADSFEIISIASTDAPGKSVLCNALNTFAAERKLGERQLSPAQTLAYLNNLPEEQRGVTFIVCDLYATDELADDIAAHFDSSADGIVQQARAYQLERSPRGIFFRPRAGYIGQQLVVTFPHEVEAAEAFVAALFPAILQHEMTTRSDESEAPQ